MSLIPPRLFSAAARRSKLWHAAIAVACLVGLALVDENRPLPFDLCGFKWLTGLPCPTCGLTRALSHLLHGHVASSMTLHPAGAIVLPSVAVWMAWTLIEAWTGQTFLEAWQRAASRTLVGGFAAVSLLFWALELGYVR